MAGERIIEVGFAELHNPLFHGKKSHGTKLDTHNNKDLHMVYDRDEKELYVTWMGKTTIVPHTNIVNYTPGPAADRRVVQAGSPMVSDIAKAQVGQPTHTAQPMPYAATSPLVAKPFTAQVSTPQSHVHAGPGKGETGRGF